jgi:anaerobic ribonucleoside-triphosphate reductase activating protein
VLENKFYHDSAFLNIANYVIGTKALGPGNRAVLWVQGCPFHCQSCYSPAWIPQNDAQLVLPEEMADILTSDTTINGITISGGEPMLQARNLMHLIRNIKEKRPEFTFILFTGFRFDFLNQLQSNDPRKQLVSILDVLIDGLYIESLNNNLGLRGSTNQKVWQISGRICDYDFETTARRNEISVKNGVINFVGIPDKKLARLPFQIEESYVRA